MWMKWDEKEKEKEGDSRRRKEEEEEEGKGGCFPVWPVASAELSGAVRPLLRPPTSQNAKPFLGGRKKICGVLKLFKSQKHWKANWNPVAPLGQGPWQDNNNISNTINNTNVQQLEKTNNTCDNLNESKFQIQPETEKCSLILDLVHNNKSYNTEVSKERENKPS